MVVMREVDKEGVAQRRHRRLKRRVYRSKVSNVAWSCIMTLYVIVYRGQIIYGMLMAMTS